MKFLAKPVYSRADLTALLNAFERTRPADRHGQRKIWNRRNTRALLLAAGLEPQQRAPGCKLYFTFAQLLQLAPDLVQQLVRGAPGKDQDEAA